MASVGNHVGQDQSREHLAMVTWPTPWQRIEGRCLDMERRSAARRGRGRGRGVSSHHSNSARSQPSRTPPGSVGPRGDALGLAGPGVEPPVELGDPLIQRGDVSCSCHAWSCTGMAGRSGRARACKNNMDGMTCRLLCSGLTLASWPNIA